MLWRPCSTSGDRCMRGAQIHTHTYTQYKRMSYWLNLSSPEQVTQIGQFFLEMSSSFLFTASVYMNVCVREGWEVNIKNLQRSNTFYEMAPWRAPHSILGYFQGTLPQRCHNSTCTMQLLSMNTINTEL